MKQKTILITGGAGYIGSHVAWIFYTRGYQVVIVDAFLHDQYFDAPWATVVRGNIQDSLLMRSLFLQYQFVGIVHCAALIEVSESCVKPSEYYENNVIATKKLLDMCREFDVKNIIFSSSCAVYGKPTTDILSENHPYAPISPYGKTKLHVEHMLQDYDQAYGIKHVALRYFNAAGCLFEQQLYEQHKPESHLIPRMIDALYEQKPFYIFGSDYTTPDGTAIRDYVHVLDIADAHYKAFESIYNGQSTSEYYNLGTGIGYSVLQMCTTIQELTNKKMRIQYAAARQGDPARLIADISKIKMKLQWQPVHSNVSEIIASALRGYQMVKNGGVHKRNVVKNNHTH